MGIEQVLVATADGQCPTHALTPAGAGPWPAAILFMDGVGIRPALVDMARRLADLGYVVLLPDLFYRFGTYGPLDPVEVFAGDFRAIVGPMLATTDNHKATSDAGALLDYLTTRNDVDGTKVGVVGFCFGGGVGLSVAGTYSDRIAAAASFHGGQLASDLPTSPHLLAPAMTAEVYVAGAEGDQSYPAAMAERLDEALTAAGVTHLCEIYSGTKHGWMMPDFPIYDEAAAERGWTELIGLFGRAFGPAQ